MWDLDELKAISIMVFPGMVEARWPLADEMESPDCRMPNFCRSMSDVAMEYDNQYSWNRGVVAFCHDSEVWVTPVNVKVFKVLDEAGLTGAQGLFYVPFSSGEYPVRHQRRWEMLKRRANKVNRAYFKQECLKYAEYKEVWPLSQKLLDDCFHLPLTGVPVQWSNGNRSVIYPDESLVYGTLTISAKKLLGSYWIHNSIVAFTTNDGETYVTNNSSITTQLDKAGYQRLSQFVPFSNNERILDEKLAIVWDDVRAFTKMKAEFDFRERCWDASYLKDVGDIKDLVHRCFLVPKNGLEALTDDGQQTIFPEIKTNLFGEREKIKLGTYNYCNNVFVVVDNYGQTFLGTDHRLLDQLPDRGYQRDENLFVPLAHGEKIKNGELAAYWQRITDDEEE